MAPKSSLPSTLPQMLPNRNRVNHQRRASEQEPLHRIGKMVVGDVTRVGGGVGGEAGEGRVGDEAWAGGIAGSDDAGGIAAAPGDGLGAGGPAQHDAGSAAGAVADRDMRPARRSGGIAARYGGDPGDAHAEQLAMA